MAPAFNLVNEPFIPCVVRDGLLTECGLQEALLRAHHIAEIRDQSPLATVALHRLLLAILHRCYQGPKSPTERVQIWQAGRFDADRIVAYLQKWQARFDLFDPVHPFFQRAGFSAKEPSGVNRLAQEQARGNNAALFDHTTDDPPPAFTPARAARALLAEQAFAVGGGKSDTGYTTHAPLVAGAVVLVQGDTLFETLWLNLTIFTDRAPIASLPSDAPVWEQTAAEPHNDSARPRGYLDYLTWQSRTIRLHPEEIDGQVVVRRVSYAQGRKLETGAGFHEPMMAYARSEKDGDRPIALRETRDLWRDSAALFQFAPTAQFKGPTTLHSLAAYDLRSVLSPSARYRVSVSGLCTDKAKVAFWRQEALPLPLAYLENAQMVATLRQALGLAEDVASAALRQAARAAAADWLTAKAGMRPDPDRVSAMVESFDPERLYWSRLELPFRQFLVELADENPDFADRIGHWYWDTLYPTAKNAFEESVGQIDGGRDLKAVNAGRGLLFARLKKIRHDNRIPERKKEGAA